MLDKEYIEQFNGVKELLKVFDELDRHITMYSSKAGYTCLKNCANCCNRASYHIETSVFEMIPAALYLWQNGYSEEFIMKLNSMDDSQPCVFYTPDFLKKNMEGGCGLYHYRGLICRVFNFSAIHSKDGALLPIICKYLKQSEPDLEKTVLEKIAKGLDVPVSVNYHDQILYLNYPLALEKFGINESLKKALEYVSFRLSVLGYTPNPDSPPNSPPVNAA